MPLEVWAGFGIGILVLALKFLYVVSIPATHTRNSSHSTNPSHSSKGIALHSWGGTHTVKSSRSARSAHSIKSSYSVNETVFFVVFFFLLFFRFFAKMAWNHVFWNMGKMEFPPETSVVSHTIAFQAILAKMAKKTGVQQLSRVSVINFWYVMKNKWCWIHGEGRRGPRILFYFRIPEN